MENAVNREAAEAPALAKARASFGHVQGVSVLRLAGQIRFVTARALRHFVDDFIAHDDGDGMLIDLRAVELLDSTALGLLARIGRDSLTRRGRRAVIVCPDNDVAICLRSAAFDELFVILDEYPYVDTTPLVDVPLDAPDGEPELGRVILDAHRDLARLSERNLDVYRDVIAALEAELGEQPQSR
jgi:anti-anti-sigma factor